MVKTEKINDNNTIISNNINKLKTFNNKKRMNPYINNGYSDGYINMNIKLQKMCDLLNKG